LEAPVEDDASYGEGRRDDGKVWDAYTPPAHRHGFDFWYSHGCCDDHARPHYWVRGAAREEVLRVEQWSAEHETDVAVDYLRTAARRYHEQGQPFALVLSYNPPHQPFDQVPERYRVHYQRREPRDLLPSPNVEWGNRAAAEAVEVAPLYYAAITGVDEQFGRLLTALDDQGLMNDTIVVFTSDHGMQLGSHGLVYKNVPYEESMRVPFLISWPGHVAPGADDLLLSSPDVAPTLLGLLGQSARRPPQMQGRDLSDQLLVGITAGGGPDPARPGAALYIGPGHDVLRLDVRGLRTHTHKLIVEAPPGGPLRRQLFDLAVDPYELADVADDQPDVLASLAELLCHELDRIGDPWPGRRIIQEELAAVGPARPPEHARPSASTGPPVIPSHGKSTA
ncbi:sulfatase-like hydrolase/transferase, partial [Micromonospora sp. MP36]|uniref:sulfatase-like hydrolase/transferase n=2 Tax=unclassified Micromonospora TaxID=2617518 RepID=UPI0011D4DD3B